MSLLFAIIKTKTISGHRKLRYFENPSILGRSNYLATNEIEHIRQEMVNNQRLLLLQMYNVSYNKPTQKEAIHIGCFPPIQSILLFKKCKSRSVGFCKLS